MTQPTAEQKRAYQWAHKYGQWLGPAEIAVLTNALRDTRAELMESEFAHKHPFIADSYRGKVFCADCHGVDPRHTWTPEQWRQAADKLYREG